MKKKIVIWGGNNKSLTIDNLDSHASVTAFFLTKYLSQYYEIINIVDINLAKEILKYTDIYAVFSTFQRGFTNRLILKDGQEVFQAIRKHVKGALCSVYDYNYDDTKYYEDIIFTVREPNAKNTKRIKKRSLNPNIRICEMGWCADPELCYPDRAVPKNQVNVFIDHPSYSPDALDCTKKYHDVFCKIKQENPGIDVQVYQQGNSGITQMDCYNKNFADTTLYKRSSKVPWIEMIGYYGKMHIFCITTPQSACLSAIEAAMCGAKLYVPKYRINKCFIPKELLHSEIPFRTFYCLSRMIRSTLLKDLERGFEREKNYQKLQGIHSWKLAAEKIHKELAKG